MPGRKCAISDVIYRVWISHRGEILLYIYSPLEQMSIGARLLDIEKPVFEISLVLAKDVLISASFASQGAMSTRTYV